jgi:hypothetical protein
MLALMVMMAVLGLSFQAVSAPRAVGADPVLELEEAYITGQYKNIAVKGGYAYVSNEDYFAAVDLNADGGPELTWYVSGLVKDIQIIGEFAYVSWADRGIVLFNLTAPHKPVEAGIIESGTDIGFSGGRLRLTGKRLLAIGSEVAIIDVADPASPQVLAILSNWASDALIQGKMLYVTRGKFLDPSEIEIYDISDPMEPKQLGYHSQFSEGGGFFRIEVRQGFIYILEYYWLSRTLIDLHVFDARDPANIVLVARVSVCDYCSGHAEMLLEFPELYIAWSYYQQTSSTITRYDVTDPAKPVVDDYWASPFVKDFYSGGRLYMAGDMLTQVELPIKTPSNIQNLFGLRRPTDLAFETDMFSLLVSGELHLTGFPSLASSWLAYPYGYSCIYDSCRVVLTADNRAITYGADVLPYRYTMNEPNLRTWDLSRIPTVELIGSFCEEVTAYCYSETDFLAASILDDLLVLVDSFGFLNFIDITDPAQPQRFEEYELPNASVLILIEDYVFAGQGASIVSIDITDVNNLTQANSISVGNSVQDLTVEGSLLFAAVADGGLIVLDISDPTHMIQIGSFLTTGEARSVEVRGQYAFVAGFHGGLSVLNISDPTDPVEVANFDGVVAAEELALARSYIMLLDPEGMLFTLRFGHSAYGRVTDKHGEYLAGVSVGSTLAASESTNWAGNYSFDHLTANTLSLVPESGSHHFFPPSLTASVPPDAADQDFIMLGIPQFITTSGGVTTTLTYTDTQGLTTTLAIPPTALDFDVPLFYTPTMASTGPDLSSAFHTFDLATTGGGLWTFDDLIALQIDYSPLDVQDIDNPDALFLAYWDGFAWVPIEEICGPVTTYHNKASGIFSTQICQTGTYALLAPGFEYYLPISIRGW